MADAQTSERLRVRCPSCGKRMMVPASAQGKAGKCPTCGAKVRIPAVVHGEPMIQPVEEQRTQEMASVSDTAEVPSPPPVVPEDPSPQVYRTYTAQRSVARQNRLVGMAMSSPRAAFLLVNYLCRVLLPLLFFIATGLTYFLPPIPHLFLILAVVSCFRRLPEAVADWIMSLLVSAIRCPGCGFENDAVDRWTIGNFTDHKERHMYLARNPIEYAKCGQTDCPQCGATIRLR